MMAIACALACPTRKKKEKDTPKAWPVLVIATRWLRHERSACLAICDGQLAGKNTAACTRAVP